MSRCIGDIIIASKLILVNHNIYSPKKSQRCLWIIEQYQRVNKEKTWNFALHCAHVHTLSLDTLTGSRDSRLFALCTNEWENQGRGERAELCVLSMWRTFSSSNAIKHSDWTRDSLMVSDIVSCASWRLVDTINIARQINNRARYRIIEVLAVPTKVRKSDHNYNDHKDK